MSAVAPSRRSDAASARRASHEAGHTPAHPAYRPDIDGLRSIAVLSVVGYHAFPGTLKGGFVGVDLFFIISGFLISTILFGNLARGRFGVVEFYERRIRRIFPALLVVMTATFAFGWFALMADEFRQLGKHLAGGAGFVSNLVFWNESGYFDTAADTKPFLHLWSLGVEEQFYIVWPLLLLATWRLRWNPFVVTLAAAAASFAVNAVTAGADPTANFYSPVTRFWELSAGSLLAWVNVLHADTTARLTQRQRDVMSLVGAAIVALAITTIRSDDVFPGWWALMPTGGAVLLIAAGSFAWFNRRVLAHPVLVWFGLISYPLYLWHWPILSFIHILDAERPGKTIRIVAVAAAIALAWATYRWLETPVRRRSRKRRLPVVLAVTMAIVGSIGYVAYRDDGFPFRAAANAEVVHPGELGHEAFYAYAAAHYRPCEPKAMRDEAERWDGNVRCLQSREGPPDLAIVGDSHAEHLFPGLADALPGRNVVFYARSALPIAANPTFDHVFETVVASPEIRTVVLSAWWSLRFGALPRGLSRDDALEATVAPLLAAGKEVAIVDDTPNFSFSPRLCKYAASAFRIHRCTEDAAFYGKQRDEYAPSLQAIADRHRGVTILRLSPYFCDDRQCSMVVDGTLALRDSDHLGIEGSQAIGRRLVRDHPQLAER